MHKLRSIFLGAVSGYPLYLFPAKEAGKRMPLQSGLNRAREID